MIVGIGTDFLDMRSILDESLQDGAAFLYKTYTEREIEQARSREIPRFYFCTHFSGKEAVFKSLRISGEGIKFSEIEILDGENGEPHCILHGKTAKIASAKGIAKVHISLSFHEPYAQGFALSETE